MLSKEKIKDLEKQGYRLVGRHSAVKVCEWAKKAIVCEDVCYKNTFYGIKSWRCVQMTPALTACTHRCQWCWRDIGFTEPKFSGKIDDPEFIIETCIKAHIKYSEGFGGNKKTDALRYYESKRPLHFAISLSGEPTLYPKLPELIKELGKRNITSFLVTNGTNPDMLNKLLKNKTQPTQIYVTLPAPDEKTYEKACKPLIKYGWKRIKESLLLLKKFKRSTIRLTLVKGINMIEPELYAELIKKSRPLFVECKAYMFVGYSQQRLEIKNMPLHEELNDFAKKIAKHSGYRIVDEKKNSRVVLMMKENSKGRTLKVATSK
ncbi:4-demethylwyosine synthase TYW1 [Candidatus Woesearchaeota archaeon]|nr:4-demethylwyosine synthase TYW1 [Candidatus Woesearchaeota archaeon]